MVLDDYRKSLKIPEAEEVFDLIFFRPLGYIFVKAIYRTSITPNQVTTLSLIAGLVAAWTFSVGSAEAIMRGAILYGLANVLDCADGQLARLRRSGTLLGRVWDGVADYISSIAVFLGIGLGMTDPGWGLVVVAGLSSGLHAMVFDHYQSAFMAMMSGNGDYLQNEINRFGEEIRLMQERRRDGLKSLFLRIYINYLALQARLGTASSLDSGADQARAIRFWSFLGPTTNRTMLIVCALFGRIDIYLWAVTAVGNIWLVFCSVSQYRRAGSVE